MVKSVDHITIGKGGKNHFKAGVAGAGGGTIFVFIAESLPASWTIKPLLIYLAPAFSVISSAFWLWILKLHYQYMRNKRLSLVLKQLEGYINNPNTSRRHRACLIRKMEEIQISVLSKNVKEVEAMFDRDQPSKGIKPFEG